MTIKEALEVLQKEYNCKTDKEYVCGSFDTCDKCGYYTSGESFTEALKTVLDAFGNYSELPNSSADCVYRQADLIDRAEAQIELQFAARRYTVAKEAHGEGQVVWGENLISVTDAMNALRKVPSVQAQQMIPTQMSRTSNSSTKFKPGSKFLLEIGEKRIGLDEYEIVGTDLYVWGSLLEKLTPYNPDGDTISRQAAIDLCKQRLYETAINNSGYKCDADDVYSEMAEKRIVNWLNEVPSVQAEQKWIPCSERLPENFKPVIVTWKNNDPASYYQYIVGKHFIGVAHYKNDTWYWYSSVTEDFLAEYGKYESEEFDEAIEVIAWMPLPEPYRGDTDE